MVALVKFIFLILLFGCGQRQLPEAPYRARIIASVGGNYVAKVVDYTYLNDVAHMRGSIGEIKGHAKVNLNADYDDVVATGNTDQLYKTVGNSVELNFHLESNVIIPNDMASMEMLGLYYGYEQTISFWQKEFDLDLDVSGKPVLHFNPELAYTSSQEKTVGTQKMNAAFFSTAGDFLFYKTSDQEEIPIKMNYGIIAHEFGHYVFHLRFANNDDSVYKLANGKTTEIDGINEGVADFLSYVVTGSVNEFEKSLPALGEQRSMPVSWTYSSLMLASCYGSYYCKGSILASALHEAAQTLGGVPVAQLIWDALPYFKEDWRNYGATPGFDYDYFLNRIVEQGSASQKSTLCASFKKWFDKSSIVLGDCS